MKNIKNMLMGTIITGALALSAPAADAQSTPSAAGVKRTDLQQHDLSIPGREVIQVRVDIPPGVVAPNHKHPGEEIIYVLEGMLEYRLEGQQPVTLKAGDVLFVPYGTPHEVKNTGTANASELATYVVEKGKPLVTLIK
jgi:quercetin dioxygenase-like cupin family protein